MHLLSHVSANNILVNMVATNSSVGAVSDIKISFIRSMNSLGQTITPSTLELNYIITIIFDSAYALNSSTLLSPSTYTINSNTQTVTMTLSTVISTFSILSFVNPLPSGVPLKITINFYSASAPTTLIDTGSSSLTFQSLQFIANNIGYQFSPGNVSTNCNLTLTITPFLWQTSKLKIKLSFLPYWQRNLQIVASNQVVNSMSYCSPTCKISNGGSFFTV